MENIIQDMITEMPINEKYKPTYFTPAPGKKIQLRYSSLGNEFDSIIED